MYVFSRDTTISLHNYNLSMSQKSQRGENTLNGKGFVAHFTLLYFAWICGCLEVFKVFRGVRQTLTEYDIMIARKK